MNRNSLIFGIALVVFAGSIVAALSTNYQRRVDLRGYADATQEIILPFRQPLLGVNVELTQYDAEQLDRNFGLMQQAGVTWVRQFAYWDQIEAAQGDYDWRAWDQIAESIQAYPSLRLVVVLNNSPVWTRSDGASAAPPDDPAVFAAFAGAFAERYGVLVDHYQIWDEPNLFTGWGEREPRPAEYAALLSAAYNAIHAADAQAAVIAAALAPTEEITTRNISDLVYLADLYALDAHNYWDAAAAKPYGFDAPPTQREIDMNFSRMVALREIMTTHGDGESALWGSNFGWNSLPTDWTGSPSIWGNVDANAQVSYTLAALDRAAREWTWAGGLILHHWQPAAPPDDPLWGFAILNPQGEPTPLWQALADHAATESWMDGLYPAANLYTAYSGVWTFGVLGADIGWVRPTDSQFEFTFTGTDVALLLRQDDYVAYLYPTIDGQPANAAPRDPDGRAYIVLTSGSRLPELQLIPVARDLPYGTHTLRVVADRGEDRWALAGFAVSSGNLHDPYDRQFSIAVLTASVAGLAVIVTGAQVRWGAVFAPLAGIWRSLSESGRIALSVIASLLLMIGMLLTWGDALPNLFRREFPSLALSIATAGLLYLAPNVTLTILAALVLFVIIYHRVDLGLMLVLGWTPFFLFPVELYRFAFPMSELLMLITASAWLARTVIDWARAYKIGTATPLKLPALNALDWGVIALVLIGIVSLLWTERRGVAVTELRVMILEPALFYLVLRRQPADPKLLLRLVDALIVAGVLVAVIGLFLYVRGEAIITAEEGARRLAGVYGSPNNAGLFFGRCIPFVLAFLLSSVDRVRRIFAAAALGLMLIAAAFTQSVGALFIGIPSAVAAVLLAVWGRRAWLALAGLTAAAVAASPFLLQSERFARVFDFTSGTNFFRIRVWQSALSVIRDHPLTGLGLDQFLYAFRGRYIIPDAWQEPNLSHPHNFLLDFWVRLGVVGVLVFLWLQLAFWRSVMNLYRRIKSPLYRAIVIGMIGGMVNLLAHGMIDNSVFVNDLAYVFVFLLGLAAQLPHIGAIDEPAQAMV